jgi:hypothetical protein
MAAYLFSEFIKNRGVLHGINPIAQSTRNWFRSKAKEVTKMNVTKLVERSHFQGKTKTKVTRDSIGRMYMYVYDPKHKKTLPYYDKFPLIFIIGFKKDGFLGINMHYLPIFYRAKLMDALYSTISNTKYDDTTKLAINYQLLKGAAKFKYFKPCVKRYLYNHVLTNYIEVPVNEWDYALFLPLARFAKARIQKVHADSLTKFEGT